MRKGARRWIALALGLLGAAGAGCSALAGIEDLQLTGSPDAAPDAIDALDSTGSGSSGGVAESGPGDAEASTCASGQTRCSGSGVETCAGGAWGAPVACASGACSGGACSGTCMSGQAQCSGNGVQSCDSGQWSAPVACSSQTCMNGACTGMCAPGQTNPVTCGNCGTDTQTCVSGAWKSSGTCAGAGVCGPGTSEACNTYGTQTCTSTCTWSSCSCATAAACSPGTTQCSGADVETCGGCGQFGNAMPCTSGTCMGGVCKGVCTAGQTQCSGNSAQSCTAGLWGTPMPCVSQTCVGGVCTGSCAPGQTKPVTCGNCGTDTETCDAAGNWQSSGTCKTPGVCASGAMQTCNTYGTETCSTSCAWGSCSCPSSPACTPGSKLCSGSSIQTCNPCGQWGSPASCGSGMTCSGTSCVSTTDCPGGFLLCDGFESGGISGAIWSHTNNDGNQTVGVDGVNPHTGLYALHVRVNAVGNVGYLQSYVRESSTFASTPVYLRAWFSLSSLPGTDSNVLMSVASNANGQSASSALGFDTTGNLVDGVSNTVNNLYDYSGLSTAVMPVGTGPASWTCLEMAFDTSYQAPWPNGHMQVWHDSSTPDGNLGGSAELQTLYAAMFGIQFTSPVAGTTNAVDLYIDDIAVDSKFIPCNQ